MAMGFRVAQVKGGGDAASVVRVQPFEADEEFLLGAVVVLTSGELVEVSADPAEVYGVALQGVATSPGYAMGHDSQVAVRTGVSASVSVALAGRNIFKGRGVSGGTDPVVPVQTTHVGTQYGIAKVDDEWVIDIAETSNLVVEIVGIVPAEGAGHGFFLFEFLADVVQTGS